MARHPLCLSLFFCISLFVLREYFSLPHLQVFSYPALFFLAFWWMRRTGWSLKDRYLWAASAALVLAIFLRYQFVFVWHRPDQLIFSDMKGYHDAGLGWLAGQWHPHQSIKPAGYSLLVALSKILQRDGYAPLFWLHIFCGMICVIVPWRVSAQYLGERIALLVLFIFSAYIPLLSLSGFFMPDTVFAGLLSLSFYSLAKNRLPWRPSTSLYIGLLCGLALWLKGNNILLGPLIVLWVVVRCFKRRPGQWRSYALMFILFAAGHLVPMGIYREFSSRFFGIPSFTSTNAGLSLVEGKCPSKKNTDSEGFTWMSSLFVQIGESEEKVWPRPFYDNKYFLGEGVSCIAKDPWVLLTSVRYVYYLFFDNLSWPAFVAPLGEWTRRFQFFVSFFLVPGMFLGFWRMVQRPFSASLLPFLSIPSLFLTSWLLKSEMHYRESFDVFLVPLATMGWSWALAKILSLRKSSHDFHVVRP